MVQLNSESLTLPLVFDIPTKYEGGDGEFYGPKDPRIIIEDNVQGAEPVIIFNMAHECSDWKRAMYTFRPFSRHLNILTIRDTTPCRHRKELGSLLPAFRRPQNIKGRQGNLMSASISCTISSRSRS